MYQEMVESTQPTEFDALIEAYIERSEPDALSFEALDQMARRVAQGRADQRLIEDYIPIEAISAEARREKSIRKGHISTLHLASRPSCACLCG